MSKCATSRTCPVLDTIRVVLSGIKIFSASRGVNAENSLSGLNDADCIGSFLALLHSDSTSNVRLQPVSLACVHPNQRYRCSFKTDLGSVGAHFSFSPNPYLFFWLPWCVRDQREPLYCSLRPSIVRFHECQGSALPGVSPATCKSNAEIVRPARTFCWVAKCESVSPTSLETRRRTRIRSHVCPQLDVALTFCHQSDLRHEGSCSKTSLKDCKGRVKHPSPLIPEASGHQTLLTPVLEGVLKLVLKP